MNSNWFDRTPARVLHHILLALVTCACLAAPAARTAHAQPEPDDPPVRGRNCGSPTYTLGDARRVAAAMRTPARLPDQLTIGVVWHVIRNESRGRVDKARISQQIDQLNRAYAGAGFRFRLVKVDETVNKEWFRMSPGSKEERAAKNKLALTPAKLLNVYSAAPRNGVLGWATFPWNPANRMQGVVVHHGSVVGGHFEGFNLGATLVHEAGHWLGLYHTFENGCDAPGDGVEDTPAEADPAFGCPPHDRDTCPAPGLDPVNNFMDYADDRCMNEFTAGQNSRMRQMVGIYRRSLLSPLKP